MAIGEYWRITGHLAYVFRSSKSNCNRLQVEALAQPQDSRRENKWATLQSKNEIQIKYDFELFLQLPGEL